MEALLEEDLRQSTRELGNRLGVDHSTVLRRLDQLDNARPHVAMFTKETIIKLDWEVMAHSAYSPDLAPSDYHLFRSLVHSLRDKSFSNDDDLKNHLDEYFESKPQSFYRDGIRKLPIKCFED